MPNYLLIAFAIVVVLYLSYMYYPVPYRNVTLDYACGRGNYPEKRCVNLCSGVPITNCKTDTSSCLTTCNNQCYGIVTASPNCDIKGAVKPSFQQYLKDLWHKVIPI